MSNKILSSFQLLNYKIARLHLDLPEKDETLGLSYFACAAYHYETDRWAAAVRFGLKLSNAQALTRAEVIVHAHFSMAAENNSESCQDFIQKLKINGTATLIPILRATVSTASYSMGAENAILIPNINVFNIEKWDIEETSEQILDA